MVFIYVEKKGSYVKVDILLILSQIKHSGSMLFSDVPDTKVPLNIIQPTFLPHLKIHNEVSRRSLIEGHKERRLDLTLGPRNAALHLGPNKDTFLPSRGKLSRPKSTNTESEYSVRPTV